MPTDAGPTVAVVGGGLAGMAAAARLAKMGHRVRLHEARPVLGGSWAPYTLAGTDVVVDDAPGVLTFPAPWRDLFRKSGRPLEAELVRTGHALVPAPPVTYRFADGSDLVLPSDRGDQHDAIVRTYGSGPAARWQHLLDSLDDVWQALRPLGLEEPYDPETLTRDTVRRLRGRRSLADLADTVGEPHLRAVVRSVAHRQGTTPERAPALSAADLLVTRTFGRWQVAPVGQRRPGAPAPVDVGRSSVLVESLAARLALRGVDVRLASEVGAVETGPDGVLGVRTPDGLDAADGAVLAVDPWTAAALAGAGAARGLRRSLRGAAPACLPVAAHEVLDRDPGVTTGADRRTGNGAAGDRTVTDVREVVRLDAEGVPVVETSRHLSGRWVRTVQDHRATTPRPGAGLVTTGFRGWRRRPGTTTAVARLALAGAATPAGPGPSAVVQSGALAAYAIAGRRD